MTPAGKFWTAYLAILILLVLLLTSCGGGTAECEVVAVQVVDGKITEECVE